jgi:hypothetical protein
VTDRDACIKRAMVYADSPEEAERLCLAATPLHWPFARSATFERDEDEPVVEFSGHQHSGYYSAFPHELRVRTQGDWARGYDPGWPWFTKAAKRIYDAAAEYIDSNEDATIDMALQAGMESAGLTTYALTPEDESIMGIALQWKIQRKEPVPEPPRVSQYPRGRI